MPTFSVSVSEAAAALDEIHNTVLGSVSESVSASDSVRNAVLASTTESSSVVDAPASAAIFRPRVSETVTAADAPAVASKYWVGGTGSWDGSTTTHWSLSSGGPGGAPVPGSGDNVVFDANSGNASTVVTFTAVSDQDILGFSSRGFLGRFTLASPFANLNIHRNVERGVAEAYSTTEGGLFFNFVGSGTQRYTPNGTLAGGVVIANASTVLFTGQVLSPATFIAVLLGGGIDLGGNSCTVKELYLICGSSGALNLTNATLTVADYAEVDAPGNLTITDTNGTLAFVNQGTGFDAWLEGLSIGNLTLGKSNLAGGTSRLHGNITVTSLLHFDGPMVLQVDHGVTITAAAVSEVPSSLNNISVTSDDRTNEWTLNVASGNVTFYGTAIGDSLGNGSAHFQAYTVNGNTDLGNNANWSFDPFPAGAVVETALAVDAVSTEADLVASTDETVTSVDTSDGANAPRFGNVTESVTASDSTDAMRVFTAARTEAASAADTLSAVATFTAARTEATSAADTLSAVATFTAARTEAASAADTTNGGRLFTADRSESVSATDSEAAVQPVTGAVTESSPLSSTQTAVKTTNGVCAESAAAADTTSTTAALVAGRLEAATAASTQTGAIDAVPRYWVGGSGTWNETNTANWSLTSGGPGGAAPPTAANDVFFDANSAFTGEFVYFNPSSAQAVRHITLTGFKGTLIQLGTGYPITIDVHGNLTLGAGPTTGVGNPTNAFQLCTFTAGSPSITCPHHRLAIGQGLYFQTKIGDTIAPPFVIDTTYYVVPSGFDGNHIQVAATPGGTPITATGTGTGDQRLFSWQTPPYFNFVGTGIQTITMGGDTGGGFFIINDGTHVIMTDATIAQNYANVTPILLGGTFDCSVGDQILKELYLDPTTAGTFDMHGVVVSIFDYYERFSGGTLTLLDAGGTLEFNNNGDQFQAYMGGEVYANVKFALDIQSAILFSPVHDDFAVSGTLTFGSVHIHFDPGLTITAAAVVFDPSFPGGTGRVRLESSDGVTQWHLVVASGLVNALDADLGQSGASGGATFQAFGYNGNVDNGGNTGWNFGTVQAGSVTESAPANDNDSAIKPLFPVVVEAVSSTTVQSAVAVRPAAVTEATTAADTVSGAARRPAAVTEATTAADTVSGAARRPAAVVESAPAIDTISFGGIFVGTVAEQAPANDTPNAIGNMSTGCSDTLAPVDHPNAAVSTEVPLTDGPVSDGPVVTVGLMEAA